MTETASLLWLENAQANRVVELPRHSTSATTRTADDLGRRQRLAAVVAAYHGGVVSPEPERLLLGWYREGDRDPVQIFTAGGINCGRVTDDQVPLILPPGGVGVRYPGGTLVPMLNRLPCWNRITVITDGLLADDPAPRPDDIRPSLDECLLRVWRGGFGWLLLAEPVPPAQIAEIARTVALEERDAQARSSSPEHAVRAARASRRHRELRQGESTGMWRIHLLAGGATPAEAAAVAGLLCSSADLSLLPYALAPTLETSEFSTALDRPAFVVSSPLVAALAVNPVEEVPGLRLVMRSEFDVTPETAPHQVVANGDEVRALTAGTVLDHNGVTVDPFRVPLSSLNRHTFVCGATGAGKSQTVRHLLEEATQAGVPWLVVEPAKAEYRQMADRIGGAKVITIRPGAVDAVPAGFNPLAPMPGFSLQTHADLVRSLFLAAFQADEPFPQVVSAALTRCYEELGWDLALGEPRLPGAQPRYPTLGDLQRVADQIVEEIGYGREVTDNVRGFIRVRLSSLRLGTTGGLFEGGHPLDFAALLNSNVVFEIEDVGDDRDKAFLMGALLIQLVEYRRVECRNDSSLPARGLRHITVFEEAHRLLRRTGAEGSTAHAVEMFASLLAEIRAYGEGLIIAEQIPSKLVPDVIKNTAVKFMHRLPALDDRIAVGTTANLTDQQSQYVVTLLPGYGAVFADGMDRPLLVRMPDGSTRERGGVTATATADPIIGRRSTTCGEDCNSTPCTLRDMRTAQHLLADEPWLVLWAELAVVGHLTGWPVPALRSGYLRSLWRVPGRRLHCGISHAVDEAIAVRASILPTSPDATRLGSHIVDTMLGLLQGQSRCGKAEIEFLSKPYRWFRLWDDLRSARLVQRHPKTREWERLYGRAIPGATSDEQAAAVKEWLDADQRDAAALRVVSFGSHSPSALERAVESGFEADDWTNRLSALVSEHFAGVTWPERNLTPQRERGAENTGSVTNG